VKNTLDNLPKADNSCFSSHLRMNNNEEKNTHTQHTEKRKRQCRYKYISTHMTEGGRNRKIRIVGI
jgi:hypothetical protein